MFKLHAQLHTKLKCDQIKAEEKAKGSATYGAEEKFIQGFGRETSMKELTWQTHV
jgi:hypothetical protein